MTSLPRLAAFLLVVAACGSPAAGPRGPARPEPEPDALPAPGPPRAAGALRTEPFGGNRWGYVEASSANGRMVVLRRFLGDVRPSFGVHGETDEEPELTLFDLATGEERRMAEIIDIDVTRRYLLLIGNDALWLADAETGSFESLGDADMEPDGNACLAPRQASFSASGKRVAWVTGKASSLTVRDLATGDRWRIAARQRIWRGWPDDEGRGAVVIEVPAGSDWPYLNTTCACRWCARFAGSYGFYGWGGAAFTSEHVGEDGRRDPVEPPEREGAWHGKTTAGCALEPQISGEVLERGPWQWRCP